MGGIPGGVGSTEELALDSPARAASDGAWLLVLWDRALAGGRGQGWGCLHCGAEPGYEGRREGAALEGQPGCGLEPASGRASQPMLRKEAWGSLRPPCSVNQVWRSDL